MDYRLASCKRHKTVRFDAIHPKSIFDVVIKLLNQRLCASGKYVILIDFFETLTFADFSVNGRRKLSIRSVHVAGCSLLRIRERSVGK